MKLESNTRTHARVTSQLLSLVTGLVLFLFPETLALAQDVEANLKTVYVSADYAMTTHKSGLVESNDTGSTTRYSLGFNVGDRKQLNVALQTETSAISFALNSTATALLYRDTRISYRMGYFYLGIVSAYAEASAQSAGGTDIFSGQGAGTGYNAGVYIPVGGRALLQVDLTSVAISGFLNKDEAVTVSMGSRTDIDIVGHLPISKRSVGLDLGYRQRTQPITVADVTTTETVMNTYIGFSFGTEM